MKRALQVSILLVLVAAARRAESSDARNQIHGVLEAQMAAWNRGDIEGFLQGYRKSNETTFVGSNGIVRGWQALLDRYRRDYPDRRAMGALTFSRLEITFLSPKAALIVGHWRLEREKGRLGGVFTLVARRFPEGWRIIHDHTTVISRQ